jgi:hypothetical protein
MRTQRQLNALLFELQTATSPLAQAKILARAWRTVRELSPTDRKLLARHAGFDGAEDILEGLAKKSGGVAPAMLLQMLSNARGTDGSALRNIMSAFRDPSRRDEAMSQSLDLAADLMRGQKDAEEVEEAVYELHADEPVDEETPDETSKVPPAVDGEGEGGSAETREPADRDTEAPAESAPEKQPEPPPAPPAPEVDSEPESTPKQPTPPPPPVVDWSRWDSTDVVPRPAPTPRRVEGPVQSIPSPRVFDQAATTAIVSGETSVLSRLRALHRAIPDLAGSSLSTLVGLIEAFPDGWARRRALSALIEAGIPRSPDDAVTLVESSLDRELDRRWCLGVLARRGDLRGASLERAGELLSSPSARRRLSAAVTQLRSES